MDKQKLFLKNYMEDCVWLYLNEVIAKYPEACSCKTCLYDVVALAMNSLPPRYVVREQGEIYSKIANLGVQYRVDIYAALTRAILQVQAYPRHLVGEETRT